MKSKILISVFFLLTTCFSFSQAPTQQWLTVINENSSTNDLFYWGANDTWYSKYPFILNESGSKIAVTNNSSNQPTASVLNTVDGSVIFSNTQPVNSNAKDLDFDGNDNLYTISASNTGTVRKFNQNGILINSINITSNCQDNLLTIKNVNDRFFVYNRNKSCSNLNYHTAHCFDSSLTQLWSNSSTDIDWYYPYDSRMIVDNSGNIIAASKKQTTQSQVNSYNIIIRKITPNGQTLWQTSYDFNNKMDILAYGNSLTTDSNNDIYFVDLNSSNWSTTSTTSRLVKINGQNGQLVFDQQIQTRTGVFGGSEPIFLISVGNQLIASSVYKVESFNSLNGSMNWSQTLGSGTNYIQNISYKENKLFITTINDGVIVLDTLGNTIYNLNVTVPGYTIKHLHAICDTTGNIFITGYRTVNNINKVFIAKFGCSVSVNAGPDLTVCQGESVSLSATSSANSTVNWSGGYQNGQNIIVNSTQTFTVDASLNGCNTSDQLTVNVIPTQIVDAGDNISVCQGQSVTLNVSGGLNYNWSDSVQSGVSFIPQTTHTYFVSASGCSNTDSITVTVNQKPLLTNGPDISTCRGSFINLNGQNYFDQSGLNFNWSNNVQNGVDFQPTQTNTYIVNATSNAGCSNIDSVTVTVNYASDTVISNTVCESYTLNGETYTESGVYTQYLINSFGCDSVIVLKISINHAPSTPILSVEDDRIATPLQSGVDFVWVRCPDNTPVNSEVGSVTTNDVVSVLTPYFSGSYSVIATNECGSVQSDCQNIEINTANIDENVDIELNVFPNPTQDFIQIDGLKNVSNFKLFDSNGKLVLSGDVDNKQLIDLSSLNKGTYQLIVNSKSLRIVRI